MGLLSNLWSSISGSSPGSEPHELGQSAPRPSTQRTTQRRTQSQSKVVILVVGRSGVGKTSLIDAFCRPNPSGVVPRYQSTTEPASYRAELSETTFSLIDTPGFDNVLLSDTAVCAKIADYFWDTSHLGVNGIIYIHRAGDPLRSRSLRRYLTVLSRVFLGNEGMHRLMILIPGVSPQGPDAAQINEELRDSNSILNQASTVGAEVICASDVLEGFTNIVKAYKTTRPIVLPIQHYNPNLASELELFLHEKSIHTHSSNQDTRLRNYQQKLEELQSTLDTKDREVVQYREAYDQIMHLHANQQDAEAALRQQLQQVQREYASLRSELQLQENFEQSEIVQELEDLNRLIDDISRSISTYLTDNHVRTTFQKEPAEVTALDARNLIDLFKLLGYHEGKCSLVSSEKGEGLDIENFLDFTIRDMLCTLLVSAIFQPFHPAIDSEQSDALLRTYEDIQKRGKVVDSVHPLPAKYTLL
ncbi:hypothetical protein B0J17DRAFT_444611 [Rhizoctonia solani]|nr:hypothetical protein B0J17DRAFT_444611 [Rhizoctonia solani]